MTGELFKISNASRFSKASVIQEETFIKCGNNIRVKMKEAKRKSNFTS